MFRMIIASIAGAVMLATAGAAQATTFLYEATLSGPAESPPNASGGVGFALVTIDDVLHTIRVQTIFSGLLGTTTIGHIHCCTAVPLSGIAIPATTVPSFPGFPVGVTTGSYDATFDYLLASTYNPAFITANGGTVAGAFAALFNGLNSQTSYLNVHTTLFPGGEIRGFLTAVPEPSTWAMLIIGFGGIGAALRRRRLALA
jgi:hypothetical protein